MKKMICAVLIVTTLALDGLYATTENAVTQAGLSKDLAHIYDQAASYSDYVGQTGAADFFRSAQVNVLNYAQNVTGALPYSAAAFDPLTNSLFVGCSGSSGAQLASLVQFTQQNATAPAASYWALSTVALNSSAGQKNPIYNNQIQEIAITGKVFLCPVVTIGTGPIDVYELFNRNTMATVPGGIADAAGVVGTGAPVAIAANRQDGAGQLIFAAIPDASVLSIASGAWSGQDSNNSLWQTRGGLDGQERGIAVMQLTSSQLSQVPQLSWSPDPASPTGAFIANQGSGSMQLPLQSATASLFGNPNVYPVSFFDPVVSANAINTATLGPTATMVWDDVLQRLYVGLTDVGCGVSGAGVSGVEIKPAVTANTTTNFIGGVCSVVVGSMTGAQQLTLQGLVQNPIPTAVANLGSHGVVTHYVSGSAAPTTQQEATVKNLAIMHTSTHYDYLLVNGGERLAPYTGNPALDPLNAWVYALPLLGASAAGGVTGVNCGQLANKTLTAVAHNNSDFYTVDTTHASPEYPGVSVPFSTGEMPAVVGADPRFLQNPAASYHAINGGSDTITPIHDMYVVGDVVYVSTDSGIHYSTPIFNASGIIAAWHPWQRVGGVINTASGAFGSAGTFGVNARDGSVLYTSPHDYAPITSNNVDTVRSSLWGTSNTVQFQDGGAAATSRGLSEIIAQYFSPTQGGVIAAYSIDPFTPGMSSTHQNSMLVLLGYQTIAFVQTMINGNPTSTFELDTNVFVMTGDALAAIAPLTSFDVVRNNAAGCGYGYVSGLGGACIIAGANANIPLWDSTQGITDFASTMAQAQCYQIPAYAQTTWLKVFGNATDFVTVSPTGYAISTSVAGTPSYNAYGVADDSVYDAVSIPGSGIIYATQNGLRVYNYTSPSTLITTVGVPAGLSTTLVPLSMVYVSQMRGNNSPQGNLYVLWGDATQNKGQVVRYYVDMTNNTTPLTLIGADPVPLIDFATYREDVSFDGALLATMLGTNINSQSNLVSLRNSADQYTAELGMDSRLSLDNTVLHSQVNGVVVTADSSRLITSSSGVFVNE